MRAATQERWQTHVTAWAKSGLTCNAYAAKARINPRTLTWWKSRLCTAAPAFVEVTAQVAAAIEPEAGVLELIVGRALVREGGDLRVVRFAELHAVGCPARGPTIMGRGGGRDEQDHPGAPIIVGLDALLRQARDRSAELAARWGGQAVAGARGDRPPQEGIELAYMAGVGELREGADQGRVGRRHGLTGRAAGVVSRPW